MTRKVRMITSIFINTSIFFFATQYHLYHYDFISAINDVPKITITISSKNIENFAVHENISSPVSPVNSLLPHSISSVIDSNAGLGSIRYCLARLYSSNFSSRSLYLWIWNRGSFAGELQFLVRPLFKCELPKRDRRRLPFKQPILMKSSENRNITPAPATSPEMLRWTFLVYDSLTTDDDVVLFVKGLNNRQGINRESNEFNCIFGYGVIR